MVLTPRFSAVTGIALLVVGDLAGLTEAGADVGASFGQIDGWV
jgi:hypothetical protein